MRASLLRRPLSGALAGVAALLLGAASLAAQTIAPPVEMRVPKPPSLGAGEMGPFLVYELHITNMSAAPLTLKSVEVTTADAGQQPLYTLTDSALAQSLSRPGVSGLQPADRATIGGGLRGVVFLWVPVAAGSVPSEIRNRITISQGTGDSARTSTVVGAAVAVTRGALVVSPPLRGGPWLAANGPSNRSGHRRALITVAGTPAIAQRFAIDYIKLNDSNTTHSGDKLKNENYLAEGVDALAVADGKVVEVKDSIPENVPGSRAVPITLETVGGNHVILDIGGGHYAFYAHLKPGSIRVKVGDTVRRGQVIGLVGNSGNSTEPHLHFHISDANSPLGSEGIPYVYDRYERLGSCRSTLVGCTVGAPQVRTRQIPLENEIVRYP
ncbi:MAG TPA: M23 family metallopeptidase [Gemmatimonadaceae bacterium]